MNSKLFRVSSCTSWLINIFNHKNLPAVPSLVAAGVIGPDLSGCNFAKRSQSRFYRDRPNSFVDSWLLKAGGWKLRKKRTQTKPI